MSKHRNPADIYLSSMLTADLIMTRGRRSDVKIGIGAAQGSEKVRSSVIEANEKQYGRSMVFEDTRSMVAALAGGEIDAAVRGDLGSKEVIQALKDAFGVDRILRVALLQPRYGRLFFLAPVGIDEGRTVEEKVEIITLSGGLMTFLGATPSFAILSGGRLSDVGRSADVDRSISEAEEVVRICRGRGIQADHLEILIEKAARNYNFVLAPDGVSGNLIFRTMHFLGDGRALGAPVVNIDRLFVDTSRAKQSYVDSIALASALAGRPKEKEDQRLAGVRWTE